MAERKFNVVSADDFEPLKSLPEAQGLCETAKANHKLLKKGTYLVCEVEHFQGRYRDVTDKIHNLLPETDYQKGIIKPTLKTFNTMPKDMLKKYLLTAYEKQLSILESSDGYDENFKTELVPALKGKIEKLKKRM